MEEFRLTNIYTDRTYIFTENDYESAIEKAVEQHLYDTDHDENSAFFWFFKENYNPEDWHVEILVDQCLTNSFDAQDDYSFGCSSYIDYFLHSAKEKDHKMIENMDKYYELSIKKREWDIDMLEGMIRNESKMIEKSEKSSTKLVHTIKVEAFETVLKYLRFQLGVEKDIKKKHAETLFKTANV